MMFYAWFFYEYNKNGYWFSDLCFETFIITGYFAFDSSIACISEVIARLLFIRLEILAIYGAGNVCMGAQVMQGSWNENCIMVMFMLFEKKKKSYGS